MKQDISRGLALAMGLALTACSPAGKVEPAPEARGAMIQREVPSSFSRADLERVVNEAYLKFKGETKGKNADYIPALAKVNSSYFGIALVTPQGELVTAGDVEVPFSIQSISKVFTAALVMEESGADTIVDKVGVDATGLPFNSVTAVEILKERSVNPFVNAGAMATTGLVKAKSPEERWRKIIGTYNAFAGRSLDLNKEVYKSEAETNQHNQGIAVLLESYNRFYADVPSTVDLYTRQCSVNVTAKDLAMMAGTLANRGVNPVTRKRVMKSENVPQLLAVMSTAGLYDDSGRWLWKVGLPAKSGVGGGLIAVAPGKLGIAAFSPPLDEAGNSVRAQEAIAYIANELNLNPYR